jgi:hypothetical protein
LVDFFFAGFFWSWQFVEMSANAAASAWRRSFPVPLHSIPGHKKKNPYTRTFKKSLRPISTRKPRRKK